MLHKSPAVLNLTPHQFLRRTALYLSLFLGTFLGSGVILQRLLPPMEIPVISSKLEAFEVQKDEIDVVFFGSSRVYRGIDIDELEKTVNQSNPSFNAFNFGMAGASMAEVYFYLKKILAMKPAKLRWVSIELYSMDWGVPKDNQRSKRMIAWHDWPHTLWIYRSILASDESPRRKYQLLRDNTVPFLYNITNAGRGYDLLGIETKTQASLTENQEPDSQGFLALDDERAERQRGIEFRQQATKFQQKMQTWRQEKMQSPPSKKVSQLPSGEVAVIEDFNQAAQEAQVNIFYLITPVSYSGEKLIAFQEKGYITDLLAYNDPVNYFDLYQAKLRFDAGHLNAEGAKLFSQYLAEEIEILFNRGVQQK